MQPPYDGPSKPRVPGSFSPLTLSSSTSFPTVPPGPLSPPLYDVSRFPQRTPTSVDEPAAGVALQDSAPPLSTLSTQNHSGAGGSAHTNFSRPTINISTRPGENSLTASLASPISLCPLVTASPGHRKFSHSQGHFEPTLPSTGTSNLTQASMAHPEIAITTAITGGNIGPSLTTSQIAAQAAVLQHQSTHHSRQRSQTVPSSHGNGIPSDETHVQETRGSQWISGPKPRPLSPPMLSLTEASVPQDNGFSSSNALPPPQSSYQNHAAASMSAATAAASIVYPRPIPVSKSPQPLSPSSMPPQVSAPPPPPPPPPEKPAKPEKRKLFSRPGKIGTKGDTKEKPLPSPGIGSTLYALQRGNFSTSSLADSPGAPAPSLYSLSNSSAATIRPSDVSGEKEPREKRHHLFLSRQKHKLKEEYHLSSAASNSKLAATAAAGSLYNFHLPSSPSSHAAAFGKAHGVRRDKKRDDKGGGHGLDSESVFGTSFEWANSGNASTAALAHLEPMEPSRFGLNSNMTLDDAWPYLKAKLLSVFEGEDLRLPIEDFNRIVVMHIQYCVQRRAPQMMFEDLRDLFVTGFSSSDRALRNAPEDYVIPVLVELWMFTFTSLLPYLQAVFLPLDLEFAGCGSLMTAEQSREFWGSTIHWAPSPKQHPETSDGGSGGLLSIPGFDPLPPGKTASATATSTMTTPIDVRRLILMAYRDVVILPRYDRLKTMFSRLSLEFLPSSSATAFALPFQLPPPPPLQPRHSSSGSFGNDSFLSSSPSESLIRPGTALSLDPSSSYNSTMSGSPFGEDTRSRTISNVSYGSASDGLRPFTPVGNSGGGGGSGGGGNCGLPGNFAGLGSFREQNVEDSKQVTELVGRMLQCVSVLASVGGSEAVDGKVVAATAPTQPLSSSSPNKDASLADGDEGPNGKMEELCRLLKLNWLGRGRTGRNRRGIVGGRVHRDGGRLEVAL